MPSGSAPLSLALNGIVELGGEIGGEIIGEGAYAGLAAGENLASSVSPRGS